MRHGTALRLGAWLGLLFGAALAGACFDAPRPAVQFSCDPAEAPQCPEGYTCEPDGCCHRNGSSYEDNVGACQLGGGGATGGAATDTGTDTTTSTTGGTSTGDATTGTTDGASTTAAGESGSGTAATDGGSTTGT